MTAETSHQRLFIACASFAIALLGLAASTAASTVICPVPKSNLVSTNQRPLSWIEKVESATFDKVLFSNERLSDVVDEVNGAIQKRHPEWRELRFVLSETNHPPATPIQPGAIVDPKTGIVRNPRNAKAEKLDLSAVRIDGELEQKGASLWDVLQLIIDGADHPITFSLPGEKIELSFDDHENYASSKRREMHDVLREYITVSYTNATLQDVVNDLTRLMRPEWDMEEFKLTLASNKPPTGVNTELNQVRIDLSPGPPVVQLAPFLEMITSHANQPITYRLLDTGVEFSFVDPNAKPELADFAANTEYSSKAPKVRIDVRFVELDPIESRARGTNWYFNSLETNQFRESFGFPTEAQMSGILQEIGPQKILNLLGEARITTFAGRKAQVRMSDTATNGETMVLDKELTAIMNPTISKADQTIHLALTTDCEVSLPYDSPYWIRHKTKPGEIPVTTLSQVMPPSRVSEYRLDAVLQKGQSIVLKNPKDQVNFWMADNSNTNAVFSEAKKREQFLLITPAIVPR